MEWKFIVSSKTASSPPSSRSFSLKLPPVLTVPEPSEQTKERELSKEWLTPSGSRLGRVWVVTCRQPYYCNIKMLFLIVAREKGNVNWKGSGEDPSKKNWMTVKYNNINSARQCIRQSKLVYYDTPRNERCVFNHKLIGPLLTTNNV